MKKHVNSYPDSENPLGKLGVKWISIIIPCFIFFVLAYRLFHFINYYAVNVLFFDEWDFYLPIFNNETLWDIYSRQHGSHRMGLGLLIMDFINSYSGWNSRWIAFAIGYCLILSTGLAVLLAVRQGYQFGISLVFCSVLFLNLRQYEQFLGAISLTTQAIPLLLLLLVCLCWYIKNPWIRLPLIGLLGFNLVFTGFGLFAACLIPVVLFIDILKAYIEKRNGQVVGGLALIGFLFLAWVLFFKGYVFASANPTFQFPYPRPWEYFPFMGSMLANSIGIPGENIIGKIIGMGLCLFILIICMKSALKLIKEKHSINSKVIFILSGFTLVYILNTAVGRISLGPEAPLVSRYVTLVISGVFAIFLSAKYWHGNIKWLIVMTVTLAILLIPLHEKEISNIKWFYHGKTVWKEVYLKTHDELQANECAKFSVYPKPGMIGERLFFLEQRKLNLFH